MKHTKKSRLCALALACVLALAGASAVAEAPGDGRPMEGNLYLEGLPIVQEPMTFTAAMVKVSIDKTDSNDKEVLKQFAEQTNVLIEWTDIPDTAWREKINIMIAGGDLPDFIIPERGTFDIITNSALLAPVNELIDKYAPHFKEYYESNPGMKAFMTALDGNMYSFPQGSIPAPWSKQGEDMWVNKTWLDKLGLSVPTDLNELYDVAKAFKESDPNGNGQADEIPILYSQPTSSFGQLNNIICLFGITDYGHHVGVTDGQVRFVPAQPEYYEALKYLNKLSVEGLLDPEGLTQNAQQMSAKGQAEPQIAGIVFEYFVPNTVGTAYQDNYVAIPPLQGLDGQDPVVRGLDPTQGFRQAGYLISRKCKTPEVLVRWIDEASASVDMAVLWAQGPEGDIWEYVSEERTMWRETQKHMANDRPGFSSGEEYRFTTYVPYMALDRWGINETRDMEANPMLAMKTASANAYDAYREKEVIPNGFWKPEAQAEKTLLATDIESYMMMFFAKSIREGIDDAKWSEHLATLERLNVGRYLELYQEFYDAQ